MYLKNWWKRLNYWKKGSLIGLLISLIPFLFNFLTSLKYYLFESNWNFHYFMAEFFMRYVNIGSFYLVGLFSLLGLMIGFLLEIIKKQKLKKSPFIHGLIVGIILILLINIIIINYCRPIGNWCLGMEYYPFELYLLNIFYIIPFSMLLSILFFIFFNWFGGVVFGKKK